MSKEIEKVKKVLVTGAAGFIGFHVCLKLLKEGFVVHGLDNLNNYYDVKLKEKRLQKIQEESLEKNFSWTFTKCDLADKEVLGRIFKDHNPEIVIHLGAQAGVRYSLIDPESYINSNIIGFHNILYFSKINNIDSLIYASSSSVYGGNKRIPYSELDSVDHPVSLYAATKKSNELMAHSYSHLYGLPCIGLRFFTVYGAWGRPDMAPMIFANAILNEKPIRIFNYGNMQRDFTYISDIVEGIYRCCFKKATSNDLFDQINPNPASSFAPHRIFNIGNGKPVNLLKFIEILELNLGKKAIKNFQPIQPGDVENTFAETNLLENWIDYRPKVSIETGVKLFCDWYKNFSL